jgi:redox-sensitive bicupin YhaK (pirin superfamily)
MEIFTYIESGKMTHQDTTGATGEISQGRIQMMSAGTGLRHSEFNAYEGITHGLQIWLTPRTIGLRPEYRELIYSPEETINDMKLLISPDKAQGSVGINQDVWIYETRLDAGEEVALPGSSETIAWLQMIDGKLLTGGEEVLKSDGVAYESLPQTVRAAENSHFLYILMAKSS